MLHKLLNTGLYNLFHFGLLMRNHFLLGVGIPFVNAAMNQCLSPFPLSALLSFQSEQLNILVSMYVWESLSSLSRNLWRSFQVKYTFSFL